MAAPEDASGDLNEGLMELGTLICTPGEPDCAACPIARAASLTRAVSRLNARSNGPGLVRRITMLRLR